MLVRYYLRRLAEYPPHIAAYKVLRKIFVKTKIMSESLKANFSTIHISEAELLKSLDSSLESIEALIKHLGERDYPSFFFSSNNKNRIVDLVKHHYPKSFEQIIADADRICEHIFDLLGSGPVSLGDTIDWHTDFKVNWTWKRKYHKLLNCSDIDNPYDVKVPWELSRCHHFITLGKAYFYTGNEKYAVEFIAQVSDWIESNPPAFGVNWACTMDVAIRIVNWLWGYWFFKESSSFTNQFLVNFLKSLLAHGRHIMSNLENSDEFPSNHYISNLVGLAYLGFVFPEFKEAKQWREFGIHELIREMERQVYPDGVDYEGSISYHRLVTELFLSATLLILLNEQHDISTSRDECNWFHRMRASKVFPEQYMQRLEKMMEFVIYYTKPDGTAPQIGDNDDGRLHVLSRYGNWDRLDHRYLLSVGAVLFNRPDFKEGAGRFYEEAFWLLGEEGLNSFNLLEIGTAQLKSKVFPQGGFYIMRHEDLYMIVDCFSDALQAPLGHRHNSRLSFELFAYGGSFIIDPGAYIYTAAPEWRNIFRSTAYHNTIQVDGQEQNEFDSFNLFLVERQAQVRINRWETSNGYDFLDAEHSGYEKLPDSIVHRRQIFFNKQEGYWLIRDILTSIKQRQPQKHEFSANLHFAPIDVAIDPANPLSLIVTFRNSANMIIFPFKSDGLELSVEQGWVSYSYGTKTEAPVARYRKSAELPVEFLTLFYPYLGTPPKIDLSEIQKTASAFMEGES
jgi:uncharacterized heparinase superfamily protein